MSRWYHDPGAIPGEPCDYLDVPYGHLDYAAAVLVERDHVDSDLPRYHAILGPPIQQPEPDLEEISPPFSSREDAHAWAEARCPAPLAVIPLDIVPEIVIRERYQPEPGAVLISIQSPPEAPIIPRGPFAATLRVTDWDITRRIHDASLGPLYPMSVDTATSIIQFVLRHRNRMTRLVIHCHAGIKRSPGVALGLAEWLPTTPTIHTLIQQHPLFNRHIYRTLCQASISQNLLPT